MVISIESLVPFGIMIVALVSMRRLLSVASMSGLVGLEPLYLSITKQIGIALQMRIVIRITLAMIYANQVMHSSNDWPLQPPLP